MPCISSQLRSQPAILCFSVAKCTNKSVCSWNRVFQTALFVGNFSFYELIATRTGTLEAVVAETIFAAAKKFLVKYSLAKGHRTIKHHCFGHLARMAREWGSPVLYGTAPDERYSRPGHDPRPR